ncbi:MAG: metalloregulator ArsR/SmtB family transcription factor [Planctomycetota bacterium]|jgi:ArsR family transcriptional regulator|nr:metalloregulator ArsR/SmtB family transcription factor [Planctomycetota bacterium]
MFDTLNTIKALADENRLRILMALKGKELCVCTLSELLNLAASTTSKHLSILKQARLIESVKDGKFVYYRRVSPETRGPLQADPLLAWVTGSLADSPQIKTDADSLREIIAKGEQTAPDFQIASAEHRLYRHVPGIHAIGNFGRNPHGSR